jgi:NAD(P)-dependent dehydrogenase (short-subunit alcohol dehydrogenase family)
MSAAQPRNHQMPSGKLHGKIALITGAASGIGRASALLFANESAAVAMVDLNHEKGMEVAAEIVAGGRRAIAIAADVTSETDCRRAIETVVREFGGLHILFNNAGIIRRATVLETSEADWDRLLDVNVKSVFLLSRLAIPVMAAGGGGSIVNSASGWGLAAGPMAAAYCASKGAVVQLTRAMAIDHGAQNIRCNCVCAGDTDTPMLREEARQLGQSETEFRNEASRRPLGRVGTAEEIARAAMYLASDASKFTTGTTLVVDGGGLA